MRGRFSGAAVLLCALAFAPAGAQAALSENARYELVHGCYDLRAGGSTVAGPLRMQATQLGQYLLYTKDRRFLADDGEGAVAPADAPSPAADWRVDVDGDAYVLTLPNTGQALAADGGKLVLVERGKAGRFTFAGAEGCPEYPEVEANANGTPLAGATDFGEVRGLLDAHMHHMAFEFLGGSIHCGRPWHRYGVMYALPDCSEDPATGAEVFAGDTVLSGNPPEDSRGWPTFTTWPNHRSLVYEQSYWKWVERAWRGGLRVFVNLFVDNEALCKLLPVKRNPECNDMVSVRREHKGILALQDYIDAQYGGPGKGFYRIVTSPFEARRVINEGKLAVVLGIEVSRLFECGVYNDVPDCSREKIDRNLDEVHRMGVRSMELVNKFDNAFAGVAGDAGAIGPVVNFGNFSETGQWWRMETCTNDGHAHDKEQMTPAGGDRDSLFNNFATLTPIGSAPLYPAAPHCNVRALTDLGDYLVRRMIDKHMLIDPDHMSAYGRSQLLTLLESKRYSGVVSSHSWADAPSLPRIYDLGGVVTPYAGSSTGFAKEWAEVRKLRNSNYFFGFGYGADMNGFGSQGAPRGADAKNPVTYPFKSFDGGVTFDKQRSGERVFDINVDGVAHYGLYPDWLEDLRKLAGDEIVDDMARGAEAYLQTWERAEGIAAEGCRGSRARATARGLAGVQLGASAEAVLRAVGQPKTRGARVWRWCVAGRTNRGKRVAAVFTKQGKAALVATRSRGHRFAGVTPGTSALRLRGRAAKTGTGVLTRSAGRGARYVYGVSGGKISWIAVASRTAARDSESLRSYLKLAGLL